MRAALPVSPSTISTSAADGSVSGKIRVRPVDGAVGRRDFIRAAAPAYAGDPHAIPPLEFEIGARLDPKANPVLKGAAHRLFIAERDGAPVGRISAIVNPMHLSRYNDATGHFGFLDAIDDVEVFDALVAAAEGFLREQGMKRSAGPFSFSVNEECGMLIEGFDSPPYVMMPHGRPWYRTHMERHGYVKAQDMYALLYRNERRFIPEKRLRFVDKLISDPRVTIRNVDFRTFRDDVRTLVSIFNDAWSENWGFIPFTDEQAEHMASELRPIITRENVVLAYVDGEPAAFALVLPNINEAIRDFGGRLLPFNWAKLIWRLKIKRPSTARMPLMGVVKKYHGKPLGAAFAYKLIDLTNSANIDRGLTASELSWILESNPAMLNMLKDMGAEIYKTYRIWQKPL